MYDDNDESAAEEAAADKKKDAELTHEQMEVRLPWLDATMMQQHAADTEPDCLLAEPGDPHSQVHRGHWLWHASAGALQGQLDRSIRR